MVDESYHAYVAYDAMLQVEQYTGISPLPLPTIIEIEQAILNAKEHSRLCRFPPQIYKNSSIILRNTLNLLVILFEMGFKCDFVVPHVKYSLTCA